MKGNKMLTNNELSEKIVQSLIKNTGLISLIFAMSMPAHALNISQLGNSISNPEVSNKLGYFVELGKSLGNNYITPRVKSFPTILNNGYTGTLNNLNQFRNTTGLYLTAMKGLFSNGYTEAVNHLNQISNNSYSNVMSALPSVSQINSIPAPYWTVIKEIICKNPYMCIFSIAVPLVHFLTTLHYNRIYDDASKALNKMIADEDVFKKAGCEQAILDYTKVEQELLDRDKNGIGIYKLKNKKKQDKESNERNKQEKGERSLYSFLEKHSQNKEVQKALEASLELITIQSMTSIIQIKNNTDVNLVKNPDKNENKKNDESVSSYTWLSDVKSANSKFDEMKHFNKSVIGYSAENAHGKSDTGAIVTFGKYVAPAIHKFVSYINEQVPLRNLRNEECRRIIVNAVKEQFSPENIKNILDFFNHPVQKKTSHGEIKNTSNNSKQKNQAKNKRRQLKKQKRTRENIRKHQ